VNKLNKVLITGASGLLGKCLVQKFTQGGWFVYAHYNKSKGAGSDVCEWLYGDFSTIEKTREFVECNKDKLGQCIALINNYGPITYKSTADITSSDLISDLHGNLIVANEITSYLLKSGNLHSVVNVGFDGVGEIMPYKKILPYAIAKAGLQLLTISYESEFPEIDFSMVSPSSLTGGEYGKISGEYVEPDSISEEIFKIVKNGDNNV